MLRPLILLIASIGLLNAQNVVINDSIFINTLLELGVDTNGDSTIQEGEALAITSLDLNEKNIEDLSGIEAFKNLDTLDCNWNLLTSLDVSALTQLRKLDCSYNDLAELTLGDHDSLRYLNCGWNDLTSLYVNDFTVLEALFFHGNYVPELEISNLSQLKWLYCLGNQLDSLDLSDSPLLEYVLCYGNGLTYLNTEGLSFLKYIDCGYNELTELDLSGSPLLEGINCQSNLFTSLDFSLQPNLTKLWVQLNDSLDYVCLYDLSLPEDNSEFQKNEETQWTDDCSLLSSLEPMDVRNQSIQKAWNMHGQIVDPNSALGLIFIQYENGVVRKRIRLTQ